MSIMGCIAEDKVKVTLCRERFVCLHRLFFDRRNSSSDTSHDLVMGVNFLTPSNLCCRCGRITIVLIHTLYHKFFMKMWNTGRFKCAVLKKNRHLFVFVSRERTVGNNGSSNGTLPLH